MLRLAALLTILATPVIAGEIKSEALTIEGAYAFETPRAARAGGGYLKISNAGDKADRLIGVRSDFPQTMIHRSTVDEQGVARMEHLMALDIPAGETVTFAPGGLHIMFMGLNGDPFEAGEQVPAVLVFEHAGEIEVVFEVKKRNHADQ